MWGFLAWGLAAVGETVEARKILADLLDLRKTNCLPATVIALIYAELKQSEQACEWLNTALRELDPWRIHLSLDSRFRCFREDPRFSVALERLSFG